MPRAHRTNLMRGLSAAPLGALLVAPLAAQVQTEVTFSADWQGPLMGVQTATGAPITEADLLAPSGAIFGADTPAIRIAATFLARYSLCSGHGPGIACGVEIDALSFGRDARLGSTAAYLFDLLFSVDEHAVGASSPFTPNVQTEALANDAAADVFMRRFSGPGPFPFGPGANVGIIDGNGARSASGALYPGLGLTEPTAPTPTVPELGDNLDALDLGPPPAGNARLYFSLEGGLMDPLEPNVVVTNSAGLQPDPTGQLSFTGGDILVVDAQGVVFLYASAQQLGLSALGLDDVDALVVVENGIAGYQPSISPYDWLPGGPNPPRDLVLFSVRRGSQVIGRPDSLSGVAITEGDVLLPPLGGGTGAPAIFVPAEALGLETQRGQLLMAGDDLDGLDVRDDTEEPFRDCNNNGVEDGLDVSSGSSPDVDGNGVPDECEDAGDAFCDCDAFGEAPCGNTSITGEGCRNNTGQGGRLVGTGTSSVATDSLRLTASRLTPNTFSVVFLGMGTASTFPPASNGRLCVVGGGGFGALRVEVLPTGPTGSFVYGPGLIADALGLVPALPLGAGSTWGFQAWYRDIGGPCQGQSNLTNGWRTTFTP